MSEEENQNPNPNIENGAAAPQQPAHWYDAEGVDKTLVSDKVKAFTDDKGSLNVNELLKSYQSAQSMVGKGIPKDDAPQAERDAFFAKLGRPESADKYDWKAPEGFEVEGVTAEHFKAFREEAHKLGLTNKQLSGVMGRWGSIVEGLQAQQAKIINDTADNTKAALSAPTEWGDKFDEKFDVTMKKLDSLGIRGHLESSGLLTPEVLKGFYGMISAKEETALKGGAAKGDSDIDARISQIKANPAYLNSSHPEHAALVKEHNALFAEKASQ